MRLHRRDQRGRADLGLQVAVDGVGGVAHREWAFAADPLVEVGAVDVFEDDKVVSVVAPVEVEGPGDVGMVEPERGPRLLLEPLDGVVTGVPDCVERLSVALGARGEAGMRHMLKIFGNEMRVAMSLTGVTRVTDIDRTILAGDGE